MTYNAKDKRDEVDGATDSRTLDEIESEEQVHARELDSNEPSPDEGAGRPRKNDDAGPM